MDPLVDVIMIIPQRFEEIIEKTKNILDPYTEEKLQQIYESNLTKNQVAYLMIQTVTIVQYYEEVGNEEVRQVVLEAPVLESVQDPEEASTEAREGRPSGGIPRGF